MRVAGAFVFFVCCSVLAGVVLGWIAHGLAVWSAIISLAAGAVAAALIFWRSGSSFEKAQPLGFWSWAAIIAFCLFSARAFLWLIFFDGDDIKFISPNNLGDLALHITLIRNFAAGAAIWPENPIYSGTNLHYPFGVDFFNALLVSTGLDVYRSLVIVGLGGAAATGMALFRWGGAFALAAFLFNGGVAGFQFFQTLEFRDYQADLAWKSIPLAMFVTQRGLLYALPAGILLLCSWHNRFFSRGRNVVPVWGELVLYSSMPLFHLHTFIFLSLLLALWFGAGVVSRKQLARFVAIAFLPAAFFVAMLTDVFSTHSAIHFKPGWMQEEQPFAHFWFMNFGLLPFFLAALCYVIIRKSPGVPELRHSPAAAFVFPSLLIFLFACFIMLARWEWDNTKLMIWCYIAVVPFLWSRLIAAGKRPLRYVACFALFFSGFVSVVGGIGAEHSYSLVTRSELDGVVKAVRDMPVNTTFVGQPTYNHPLLLAGRKMVMGYPGHLWSHGIDFSKRERQLKSIMMGAPDWREEVTALNARYLFWGPREAVAYPGSTQPWVIEQRPLAEGAWGAIYEVLPKLQ